MKPPDRVFLDETKPDPMRLHHAAFMGKLILAVRTWTYDFLLLHSQTMLLSGVNKLFHATYVAR
jgi:hypothetical protein